MEPSPLASVVVFHLGPIAITRPVVTTWAIMLALAAGCGLATRRLPLRPNRWQTVLELVVSGIAKQIEDVIGKDARPFLPLLGTLFIFLVTANLSGLLPGVEAPTGKIETPAALALIVFFSVHYFGVRKLGLWGYLKKFAEPSLLLLPFNLIANVTRTFSLAIRLFGNMLSHQIVVAVLLLILPLILPAVLQVFGLFISVLQAYIFTILTVVYIAGAVRAEGEL